MREARKFDLRDRLVQLAVRVLTVVESLPDSKAGKHVASQLIRSGTSPAPNYGEAQSAESQRDSINRLKVALKELRETLAWLQIIERKPLCPPDRMRDITDRNLRQEDRNSATQHPKVG